MKNTIEEQVDAIPIIRADSVGTQLLIQNIIGNNRFTRGHTGWMRLFIFLHAQESLEADSVILTSGEC